MASERFVGFSPTLEKGRTFERAERPTAVYESSTLSRGITYPHEESTALYAPARRGRTGASASKENWLASTGMNALRNGLNVVLAPIWWIAAMTDWISYGRGGFLIKSLGFIFTIGVLVPLLAFAVQSYYLLGILPGLAILYTIIGRMLSKRRPVELPKFLRVFVLDEEGNWTPKFE